MSTARRKLGSGVVAAALGQHAHRQIYLRAARLAARGGHRDHEHHAGLGGTAGGVLGLGFGGDGAWLLHRLAGWNTMVAPGAALAALGFASAVGLVFGLWPARRAAALPPILALRYE